MKETKFVVEMLNPVSLNPAEYNPREITEVEFEKLKNSLEEFGFVENVIINKDNQIIGGHMRVKAAIALGIELVPCLRVDLTKNKEKLLNLALNKISGRWDNEKLGVLITELANDKDIGLAGFESWELDYYNQGPDNSDLGDTKLPDVNLQGDLPNESSVLLFVFDNETKAKECSEFINDGKYLKSNSGEKLLQFINELKNEKKE